MTAVLKGNVGLVNKNFIDRRSSHFPRIEATNGLLAASRSSPRGLIHQVGYQLPYGAGGLTSIVVNSQRVDAAKMEDLRDAVCDSRLVPTIIPAVVQQDS